MQIQSLTAKPDQESVQAPQPMAPHGFGPSHGVNCTYCKEAVKGWTAAVLAAPVPFQVGHFVPTALPRLWNLFHGYRPHLLTHSVNPHVLWKVHLTSTYLTVKSETKTSTRCWDFSGAPCISGFFMVGHHPPLTSTETLPTGYTSPVKSLPGHIFYISNYTPVITAHSFICFHLSVVSFMIGV